MFWGLILEPSKLYSQIVEKPFHISQAALDLSTGDSEFCQVMVSVDRKKFLICTLQKPGTIQVALDLYFKAGESITFVTNGLILEPSKLYSQIVEKPFHISQAALDLSTGDSEFCQVMVSVDRKKFLICTLQKPGTIQVALDLYFKAGESITFVTNGKCNIHLTGYLDPEFEDEDEEEDEEEQEEDDEVSETAVIKRKAAPANNITAKKVKKVTKVAEESDSESDEDQLTKFLDGRDIDTDEDDETFTANTSTEADDSDEEDSDEEEEAEEEEEDEDEDAEDGEKEINDSVDYSKLTKSQKRRLKKKLSKQSEAKPKVNGVSKTLATNITKESKKEEKKEEKKKEKKEPQKEKKALTGGVQIEDLKAGNGPLAKAGKVVSVYYEGRLKQNNKTFDKCNKGPGFKFKLGAKEVISGWDIGVAGMKVGGVRKIVCPPPMAYGAKGSPPVIPPNSTLVFEVELKSVK